MDSRRHRFAPLWVYLFGLFAVATGQRLLFAPDERSAATNVTIFTIGALIVIVVITVLERSTHR